MIIWKCCKCITGAKCTRVLWSILDFYWSCGFPMQNHNGWYGREDLFMLIKAVETAFGLKCKRRARDDMARQKQTSYLLTTSIENIKSFFFYDDDLRHQILIRISFQFAQSRE